VKILIIDDDPGLRRSLSLILSDAGYDVLVAEDGEVGLTIARDQRPDIILCDVRMPKLGGLQFLEVYREEGGQALILVMTAYGGLDLAMEAMKKGAYDYIPKPFGSHDVLLIVRKAEERERLRREVGRLRNERCAAPSKWCKRSHPTTRPFLSPVRVGRARNSWRACSTVKARGPTRRS
jgi:two-component system response regulator AtoC